MAEYLQGIVVASRGIPVTLIISLVAVTGGMIIGLFVAIAKRSKYKILRAIATVYVDILRGTPLLVQVLILAYGVPQLLKSAFGLQFNWEHMIIVGFIACGIQQLRIYGRDNTKRSSGNRQRADGSCKVTWTQQRTDHEIHNSSAGIQDHRSCARKRIRYSHQGDVDTFRSRYCRDHKARYAVGFIFVPVVPGIYRCCYSLSRDDSYAVQTGCVYRKEDGSE